MDAGIADAGDPVFEPSPIAEPEAPRAAVEAPRIAPCPPGWSPVDEGGLTTCDPFPGGSSAICPVDAARFPGSDACAPIGVACTADPYASDLPADRTVLYVDGSGRSGNGTRASPYGSIASALAAAPSGVVLALAQGVYDEVVELGDETLWGACIAMTEVRSIRVTGSGALRNLRVGGWDPGIEILAGASVHLEDVVVAGAFGAGIVMDTGGTLTGARVVVRETADGSRYGRGLTALGGAQVTLASAEIYGNQDVAVVLGGAGTIASLMDVTVRDTLPNPSSSQYGVGILIDDGARLELVRGALERNRDRALWAYGAGSTAIVTDTMIRDTRPQSSDDTDGIGVNIQLGGIVSLERVVIDRSRGVGILMLEADSTLSLTDSAVLRTDSQVADGDGGRGLNAQTTSHVTIERARFADNRDQGVFIADRADLTAKDLAIVETRSRALDGTLGAGLAVNFTAIATVERLHVSRARQAGVIVGEGSELTLSDAVIEDTLGYDADQDEGAGMVIQARSKATVARLAIERARTDGIFIRDAESVLDGTDIVIRDVVSSPIDGKFGRGIAAEVGGRAEIERVLIERTQEHALMVNSGGAALFATDIRVLDTRARDSDGFPGRALAVQDEGHAEITRGRFTNSVEVGLFISGGAATATLTDVAVERTESRRDAVGGRGLDVSLGAKVVARGIAILDSREFGAAIIGADSRAELMSAVIARTRENACPTEECLGFGRGGTGIAAAKGAAIVMRTFRVEHSALAGLALTRNGTIDLFEGEVAFNPVGVNVDAEGYDLARLQNGVRYHDNELTLQSTSLPEPRSSDVIAGIGE